VTVHVSRLELACVGASHPVLVRDDRRVEQQPGPSPSYDELATLVMLLRGVVGSPGGIAPPGSHRTEREPLGSLRSSHRNPASSRVQAQWANSRGSRSVTPDHHRVNLLQPRSRLYFLPAQRIR
jgi:hypothetical protein